MLEKLNGLSTRQIKANKDLVDWVMEITSGSPEDTSITARIWLVKHGLTVPPPCPNGSALKFTDGAVGYQFCGRVKSCPCAAKSQREKISLSKQSMSSERVELANSKRRATVRGKYGVDFVSQHPEMREKMEQTCMDRYGVKSNLSSDIFKKRIKETNIEKYGFEHATQNEDVKNKIITTKVERAGADWSKIEREKARSTMLDRYGFEHALQVKEFNEQRVTTNLERWGFSHACTNPIIKDKIRATNQIRYGVDYYFCLPYFREESKAVLMERYGVDHPTKSSDIKAKMKANHLLANNGRWRFQSHLSDVGMQIFEDDDQFVYLFNEYGLEWLVHNSGYKLLTLMRRAIDLGLTKRAYNVSKGENEVAEFIESLGISVTRSDRTLVKPKEIDIWIPSHKLGIEYCGEHWHSERYKDKTAHYDKMVAFEQHGKLLTIYESEWKNRRQQVEGRIRSIIGKNQTVGGRNCNIVLLDKSSAVQFMEQWHIQGSAPVFTAAYGLEHNGIIVSTMAFLHRGNGIWEMVRFCSSLNVIGGASRLLGMFKKEQTWEQIISFADRRWSTGDLYHKIGFEVEKEIPIDYSYTKQGILSHKFNHRKQKYKERYDIEVMTEKEIMAAEGWNRIWDCGKIKFVMKR